MDAAHAVRLVFAIGACLIAIWFVAAVVLTFNEVIDPADLLATWAGGAVMIFIGTVLFGIAAALVVGALS